jgi:hypothetical protein
MPLRVSSLLRCQAAGRVGPDNRRLLSYPCSVSSSRHEGFDLPDFWPVAISILGQLREFAEVGRGLILQTGFLRGLRGAVEPA